jgi:hypothetical protein
MTTSDVETHLNEPEPTLASGVPPVPPVADDDEPEFRPRPRRRLHTLTWVLVALVIAGLGFLGGIITQKHVGGTSSTSATTTGAAARFANRTGANAGGTAGGGGGGFGGGATVGTVTLVDGKNVYVTTTNGNVVKVVTNGGSQLSKTDTATIKDIAPGSTVVVRGTTNADGTVTATTLTVSPAGSSGGFAGFGGRAGAGG